MWTSFEKCAGLRAAFIFYKRFSLQFTRTWVKLVLMLEIILVFCSLLEHKKHFKDTAKYE